jgi:hypothetical protein
MCQKTWWLVSAVLTIAAFGGGLGVGIFCWPSGQALVDAAPQPGPENAHWKLSALFLISPSAAATKTRKYPELEKQAHLDIPNSWR